MKATSLVRPRVLVVDDDEAMRVTCCALLETEFDVEPADGGAAALSALEKTRFDVLCTDYKMPGMSGLELMALAAKLKAPPSLVLVTAYAEFALRQRSPSAPPHLLLVKPYHPLALIEVVRRAHKLISIRRQLAAVVASLPRGLGGVAPAELAALTTSRP